LNGYIFSGFLQALASTTVLMPCMVAVQACLASGVKAEPRLAAKKSNNTLAKFCCDPVEDKRQLRLHFNICSEFIFLNTHVKMGASSTAILVLVGQFNQLSVQTIRVAHTVDEFRQLGQDIDRQGLIV
jgi:hypothetical protein